MSTTMCEDARKRMPSRPIIEDAECHPVISVEKLRLLVVIASYGEKNLTYLEKVIQTYRSLKLGAVEVLVISDIPRRLAGATTIVVDLRSKNPWSLPFAHKEIFAQNIDKYDLFAYSEDDIEVTQSHIEEFLRATSELNADELAGFDLYEIGKSGEPWLPGAHGRFHWKPDSVRRRGPYTIAEFSNEHAGFYLLTQTQLRRCIASGGFLREPYEARYDMLCAAATDPYTSCGFHKVICISNLDQFLLHHLPNRYVGKRGLPLSIFKEQVRTLEAIEQDLHPVTILGESEPAIGGDRWSKSYYEQPSEELIELIPEGIKNLLSIGCGSGATESHFISKGVEVTALPLDSIIGAMAARRGIKVIYDTLEKGVSKLKANRFDCIILINLLHLMRDPVAFLRQSVPLLRPGGTLVLSGPNFDYIPIFVRRLLRLGEYRKLRSFELSGINAFNIAHLRQWLSDAGLELEAITWRGVNRTAPLSSSIQPLTWPRRVVPSVWNGLQRGALAAMGKEHHASPFAIQRGRFFAETWIVRARRKL